MNHPPRPLALDLYCCAGGMSVGLHRAGFDVVGVDIDPQPNYPFEFHQANALDALATLLGGGALGDHDLRAFALIHASPPCQSKCAYRRKGHGVGDGYLNLIPGTRALLKAAGLPYVIENVEGFRGELRDPVRICGTSFPALDVQRHRLFESSLPLVGTDCAHNLRAPRYPGATNRGPNTRRTVEVGVWRIPLDVQREAMGMHWSTLEELSEAIPPAYGEHIGRQILERLVEPA